MITKLTRNDVGKKIYYDDGNVGKIIYYEKNRVLVVSQYGWGFSCLPRDLKGKFHCYSDKQFWWIMTDLSNIYNFHLQSDVLETE